ncbi:MAG: putative metal-binding motif-containing protein [Sandaracinus sp.]|nr:putative metal-binding motif-containing protein [Sandaracinus sp.]MCB9619863.1 putative metal-binding motif-containing protein [Sandaracinus sp.]MCB9634761.1 putative metal-binding motif-containing protein [Sandaracinus sp.]
MRTHPTSATPSPRTWFVSWALLALACGGEQVDLADAGALDGDTCVCDDGLFCNGLERCEDGACVPGDAPCEGACDETSDICTACVDADGDGRASAACGGDDCDDDDPNVFRGNREICDPAGVDEDCDPSTVGDRDADRDGYEDVTCCNGDTCGTDCNDAAPNVHPTAPEVCNGRDDDCDGSVDEGVLITFYRDADGDNYGVDERTVQECSQPSGYVARGGDCEDDPLADPSANERNPGQSEVCDDVDQDCDGRVDEGVSCDCTLGVDGSRACGFDPALDGVGNCRLGTQSCGGTGQWSVCGGGLVAPSAEVCNGDDDDCDGMADEGVRTTCWRDADDDGYAPASDPTMVICGECPTGHTSSDPSVAADCDDADAISYPGAAEICDRLDNDCSRATRAEPSEDADGDGHAPRGAACTGGFPKDDCRDDEPRAFPGQTQYFGVGYCPSTHPCPCNGGCNATGTGGRCGLCSPGMTPTRGATVFDFDCDGSATRRANAMSSPACSCGGGFGCNQTAYYSYSRFAICGSNATRWQCTSSCPCSLSTTTAPLPCR